MSEFDKYFETPYVSSTELGFWFGCPSSHTWTILKFGMAEAYDDEERRKIPKPVVWFLEVAGGQKYVFINKTSFKALRDRFGPGFDEKPEVRGQLVSVLIERKNIGGKMQPALELLSEQYPDQWAPMGADRAAAARKKLNDKLGREVGQDEIVRMIMSVNEKLSTRVSSIEQMAEWPTATLRAIARYLDAQHGVDDGN